MKYFLCLILTAFLWSCQAQKTQSKYSVIEYEAGACFGFCPIFKMTINSDKTAVLEAEHFNFSKGQSKDEFSLPREGTFKTTIKKEDYDKLIVLLDDLDVKNLKTKYGNYNITDLPSSYLRIKFSDNTSKNTQDYGKRGTEKLVKVYQFFEDLKHNQTWKKVE